MGEGALIVGNNSGHNVLMLKKQASQNLVALATLYYTTQVAWQARGMEAAKRRACPSSSTITLFDTIIRVTL
jgi:hypothetical protein